jgi:hypothetical protein
MDDAISSGCEYIVSHTAKLGVCATAALTKRNAIPTMTPEKAHHCREKEERFIGTSFLAEMKAERKNIQWEYSYIAGDKTFCIYLAESEALIHEHARRSGFPATYVTVVHKMIAPVTAEG